MASIITRDLYVMQYTIPVKIPYAQQSNAVKLTFAFKDYTIPSNATARVYVRKTSGKEVYTTATINTSSNTVSVTVTTQMVAEAGEQLMNIQLISGSTVLISFPIILDVAPSAISDSSVQSKDVFDVLTTAVNSANSAASSANSAASSANSAASSANSAASRANTATSSANSAASSANSAASNANSAASSATSAASSANTAASSATTAAETANNSAERANAAVDKIATAVESAEKAESAAASASDSATAAAKSAELASSVFALVGTVSFAVADDGGVTMIFDEENGSDIHYLATE